MIDIAIIPARGGSQGLPGKNIANLGGYPLIAWTVRAACVSGLFKRVVVSTDSEEIAAAAKAAGAEVPFIRPAHLATSEARSSDVVFHAIEETGVDGVFALLQPTSPFRNSRHLQASVSRYQSDSVSSLISVAKGKPLAWQLRFEQHGRLERASLDVEQVHRRQDAEPLYTPNGAIYLCSSHTFKRTGSLFHPDTMGYEMSMVDSIDIDEAEDLELARAIVGQGLRVIDS